MIINMTSVRRCLKIKKFINQIPIIIPTPISGLDMSSTYSLNFIPTIVKDTNSDTKNPIKYPVVTPIETPDIPNCNKTIAELKIIDP